MPTWLYYIPQDFTVKLPVRTSTTSVKTSTRSKFFKNQIIAFAFNVLALCYDMGIRYLCDIRLHCNLFSLTTSVAKDKQNITLFGSEEGSMLPK